MSELTKFSSEPMLCESADWPPEGSARRYELKLDRFRMIGRKAGRQVQVWSRNQKNFARRFSDVVRAIRDLPDDTVIDGELVALDGAGEPSFDLLLGIGNDARPIILYAFDLLMLRGKDVRAWPLEDRRAQLGQTVERFPTQFAFRKPSMCGLRSSCGP